MDKPGPEKGRSMERQQQNIQDGFLNSARKSFDKFSVVLESSSQEQLIFKHAISTVVLPRAASAAAAPAASAGS
jgi:sRNA-binding regulator protein Hfq